MSAAKTLPPAPTLAEQHAALLAALRRYVNEYPAFRTKPVGAPESSARREQDRQIQIEDQAMAAITDAVRKP